MGRKGFTLLEMLAVLAITALITVFAVPSWRHLSARLTVTAQVNQLLGQIEWARSEAVKRGRRVVICKSTDQSNCARGNTSWNSGWIAFADLTKGSPIERDPADPILIQHRRARETTVFTANRRFFRLEPDGTATNGTFTVCDGRGGATPRAIIISRVGRARVSARPASGSKLHCP